MVRGVRTRAKLDADGPASRRDIAGRPVFSTSRNRLVNQSAFGSIRRTLVGQRDDAMKIR
jgi:hypothetical protein